MRKLFLDTNIIIDFLGERVPHYEAAAKVLTLADKKKIQVFTTATSLTNAYYILAKYEGGSSALAKIKKFRLLCDISKMNHEVVDKALHSEFSDFEDAIQYFSALATDCKLIITRNEKDFKNSLIPVMDAVTFLIGEKTI